MNLPHILGWTLICAGLGLGYYARHLWVNTSRIITAFAGYIVAAWVVVLGVLLLGATLKAQTSWTLELQSYETIQDGTVEVEPMGFAFTAHRFDNSPYSATGFVSVSKGWGEFLAGISREVSSEPFVEIGAMAGVEQPSFSLRGGVSLFALSSSNLLYLFLEKGVHNDDHWYLFQLDHHVSEIVTIGLHAQRYNGVGLRASVQVAPLTAWVAALADPEKNWTRGLLVGVNAHF